MSEKDDDMAEDQYSLRGAQFRGSRYPGFVSPNVTPVAVASTGTGALADTGPSSPYDFGGQMPEIPDPMSELGKSAGGAAATFATTKFGEGAGAAIGQGAGIGEAASAGLDKVGQSVSSLFDFSGNAAAGAAGSAAAGSAAGSAVPTLAGGEAAATFGTGIAGEAGAAAAGSAAGGGAPASSLASEGFGARLAAGSNIGGAIGTGLGTAAVGLLMGQKPAEAAKSGLGAGAGFYVGNVILPGVGGLIGGALGSVFCFTADTPIVMADGSTKAIEKLRRGDEVALGGRVTGHGEVDTSDVYLYRGTLVAGGHAVFERGKWIRVEESVFAKPLELEEGKSVVVYPIETEHHLLVTPCFVAADVTETPETWQYTDAQRLELLNADADRNQRLATWEREYLANGGLDAEFPDAA